MSAIDRIVNSTAPMPRPKIVCTDGFTLSVQASWGHYSTDSEGKRPDGPWAGHPDDTVLPWQSVEVGYPSQRPEPWAEWADYCEAPERPTETVYGYVPVEKVRALIESHGGAR